MTERQIIADILEATLQNVDKDYRVEQRLRRVTFDASTRAERVAVMGDNTTYAEVLTDSPSFTSRRSGNQAPHNNILFNVNIWYGYKDSNSYNSSSQKVFDQIIEDDHGVLKTLSSVGGQKVNGEFYYIDEPQGITVSEVSMSNDGRELAHYMTFQITVRQK